MCAPGGMSARASTVARCLSAVQVEITSASATASAAEPTRRTRKPSASACSVKVSIATGSVSKIARSSMPSSARRPSAWNGAWQPVPMSAARRESRRARWRAASAEVAAVRRAVSSVISDSSTG